MSDSDKQHSFLAELGNLLILAQLERQKKTVESNSTYRAGKDSTVDQRRPIKASVNRDSTRALKRNASRTNEN